MSGSPEKRKGHGAQEGVRAGFTLLSRMSCMAGGSRVERTLINEYDDIRILRA